MKKLRDSRFLTLPNAQTLAVIGLLATKKHADDVTVGRCPGVLAVLVVTGCSCHLLWTCGHHSRFKYINSIKPCISLVILSTKSNWLSPEMVLQPRDLAQYLTLAATQKYQISWDRLALTSQACFYSINEEAKVLQSLRMSLNHASRLTEPTQEYE